MKKENQQLKKWNMKRFNYNIILNLIVGIIILISTNIYAQNTLSLKNALSITLQENIDIKIKKNELNQIKNYEKVGVLNVLPRIKINASASGNKGNSSLKFATDDFPQIEDASVIFWMCR